MHADARDIRSAQRLTSLTRPTPLRDPIEFFASTGASTTTRALWLRPRTGEALVSVGSACTLVGVGEQRFRQIADAWRNLLSHASIEGGGGPVLLGGFSFDPARASTRLWDGFPDARMVLPEHMLSIHNGSATLTTNRVADQIAHIPHAAPKAEMGLSPVDWQHLVGTVAAGIRGGELGVRKVVLASTREARPTVSLEAAIRTLARDYPGCTVFAVVEGDACFLGATPERLISLHEGMATTMALAGSAPRGRDADEDARIEQRLLDDPKERDEHAIVVSALKDSLGPLCERVVVDAAPRVRKLDNVQHLLTTIRGQVKPDRSVLDLVERLHPTPAVGGSPRAKALALIRQHEALDRGWYAAPIGWMDRHGEGEFVVGLRSALVRGETATLFAGCGIVAGSNPLTEYAEWGWKLRPMQSALGVKE
jgi:isochorismate synthase